MGSAAAAHVARHMAALLADGQLAASVDEWGHVLIPALTFVLIGRLQVLLFLTLGTGF